MAAPLIGLWLSLISPANATTMVPLNLNQLVDASDTVVRGTVTEMWTEADARTGTIWTHAQIDISGVLKGEPDQDVIIVEQPGGQLGQNGTIVEGVARFSVGEEGYFFVEALESDRNVTVGMFQGKYNVRLEPNSRQEIVVRFPVHPARSFDHRFIPFPEATQQVFVTSFEEAILNRVEIGWDGKAIPGTSLQRLQDINTPKRNGAQ